MRNGGLFSRCRRSVSEVSALTVAGVDVRTAGHYLHMVAVGATAGVLGLAEGETEVARSKSGGTPG